MAGVLGTAKQMALSLPLLHNSAKQMALPLPLLHNSAGLGSSPVVCPIKLADSQDERDEDEGDHGQAPGRAEHEHEDDGCLGG